MTKTPISRKTLREQVAEILRKKILNGDIQSGERIVEADLARELQMSRGPVREALRQIEEEGLVVYEPHKGCVVKTMTYDEDAGSLSDTIHTGNPGSPYVFRKAFKRA